MITYSYSNRRDDEYAQSLKERIVRVESLLKTAGILYEDDINRHTFSAHENEALEDDIASTSNLPSRRASSLEIKNGDLEGTPLFRADERDESRYIGKIVKYVRCVQHTHSKQGNLARYQFYHEQE